MMYSQVRGLSPSFFSRSKGTSLVVAWTLPLTLLHQAKAYPFRSARELYLIPTMKLSRTNCTVRSTFRPRTPGDPQRIPSPSVPASPASSQIAPSLFRSSPSSGYSHTPSRYCIPRQNPSPAASPGSAAPNTAPPPATHPRSACTDPSLWAWVRLMCTPASAVTPRTASLFVGPCGISVPAPHSSALFVCRFGCPSTGLLSFPDSLSGRFSVLLGVYLFFLLSATNLHFFLGVFLHFITGADILCGEQS